MCKSVKVVGVYPKPKFPQAFTNLMRCCRSVRRGNTALVMKCTTLVLVHLKDYSPIGSPLGEMNLQEILTAAITFVETVL